MSKKGRQFLGDNKWGKPQNWQTVMTKKVRQFFRKK